MVFRDGMAAWEMGLEERGFSVGVAGEWKMSTAAVVGGEFGCALELVVLMFLEYGIFLWMIHVT